MGDKENSMELTAEALERVSGGLEASGNPKYHRGQYVGFTVPTGEKLGGWVMGVCCDDPITYVILFSSKPMHVKEEDIFYVKPD